MVSVSGSNFNVLKCIASGYFNLCLFTACQFAIKVDLTELLPGIHYAGVCAVDVSKCFQGALFRVPVAAIISLLLLLLLLLLFDGLKMP